MSVTLKLPERRPPWTAADAASLTERVRDTIIARTRRGVGSDGRRFDRKADGSPSRLQDTGRLLDSLQGRVESDQAVVEATVDYAQYVEQERPFLALTKAESKKLQRELEREIGVRLGADR